MKIGMYGGTFDPPHLGHMLAAKWAKELLSLDKLIVIPTRTPPHKELDDCSASPEARLEMARLVALAIEPTGSVTVSDCELCREGKSYTADTVEELFRQYPEDELWVVMGSDMFLTFEQWQEPERICALAGVCGFTRAPGEAVAPLKEQAKRLQERYGAKTAVLSLPEDVNVSSTEIRELLERGDNTALSKLLWSPVYGYILRHSLYGMQVDLKHLTDEQLRAVSYSMMLPKRIPHVQGTEEEAVKLAKLWGADVKTPAGRLFCTTAPNTTQWTSIWLFVSGMTFRWTPSKKARKSFSTPRRARRWPAICLVNPRRSRPQSTTTPPAKGT